MENRNDDRNIFGVCSAALGILAWLLCRHFGQPQYGRGAFCTTSAVFAVIWGRWDSSDELWFWETMLGLVALQVPLTMVIAETTQHWSFPLLFYPIVADAVAMLAVIEFVKPPTDTPKDKTLRR